jgi:hypothetical protein
VALGGFPILGLHLRPRKMRVWSLVVCLNSRVSLTRGSEKGNQVNALLGFE